MLYPSKMLYRCIQLSKYALLLTCLVYFIAIYGITSKDPVLFIHAV